MYSVLVSLVLGLLTFVGVAVLFDPVAAVVPAVLVFTVALVAILLRVKRSVDALVGGVVPLLEQRRVQEAEDYLDGIRKRFGRWMPLLDGQIEAQMGMIDYFQLRFDKALPKLQKGKWQNWVAQVCIGAIHFRKGRKDEAWEVLEKAIGTGSKEPMTYVVYAMLLTRSGNRDKALDVLNRGLKALPDSKQLQELKGRIANKKKIKPAMLGDGWGQFFPEDLVAQAQIQARRAGPMPGAGFRGPSMSKAARRGR